LIFDECYPTADVDTDADLWAAVKGCIVGSTNFCECDSANGWAVGTGGACVAECLISLEGTDTGGADECWHTANSADLAAL